jgi:hypothetical protein
MMNKRIKELAEQAELTKGVWKTPDFILEKFAELIVKECADKCLEMAYVNPGPHHYAAMIKEHFGVEE